MGVADSGYGFAPLAPQFWGEKDFLASPKVGGFRGLEHNQMIMHSFLDSATPESLPYFGHYPFIKIDLPVVYKADF
ncbi:hypothetical protein BJP37_32465 [Moorena bouillonii PNG]|uniref:Uncharacterized protein n=1 Tax=Moorena bouillonii PNG TaxID=568701 RepID=A0A1U7MVD1_9CYAN|nr:hypothetical protein BJP37_32465 [Moorena bouillonii PNG]